jgi:hypothetical protein
MVSSTKDNITRLYLIKQVELSMLLKMDQKKELLSFGMATTGIINALELFKMELTIS